MVSTALPTIVSDLGGGAHMSWVVTSYMLAARRHADVEVDRIVTAWREWLLRELRDCLPAIEAGRSVDDPIDAARINAAVDRMVVRLVLEDAERAESLEAAS